MNCRDCRKGVYISSDTRNSILEVKTYFFLKLAGSLAKIDILYGKYYKTGRQTLHNCMAIATK